MNAFCRVSSGLGLMPQQKEDSDAWDDFNVEQQASIVENWFKNGTMSLIDERYPFIEKIIKPGIRGGAWANIMERTLVQLPLNELRTFKP
jgi:hypothetical protein